MTRCSPPGPGCGPGSRRTRRSCGTGTGSPKGRGPGRRRAKRRTRCGAVAGWPWAGAGGPVRRAALPGQALAFVDASVAAEAAGERAARRRTRWLQGAVAVLAALVLAVAGLSGYAFSQRAHARGAESTALRAASLADSRAVAFPADQLRGQDPAVAAQLSVSAAEFAPPPQATASLLGA